MKMTLSTGQAASILAEDGNGFTYSGARALIEYLEEIDENMELDCVAIRCDFAQYDGLQDWAQDYFSHETWLDDLGLDEGATDEEIEAAAREYVQDNGQLIEFNGGVIVSSF